MLSSFINTSSLADVQRCLTRSASLKVLGNVCLLIQDTSENAGLFFSLCQSLHWEWKYSPPTMKNESLLIWFRKNHKQLQGNPRTYYCHCKNITALEVCSGNLPVSVVISFCCWITKAWKTSRTFNFLANHLKQLPIEHYLTASDIAGAPQVCCHTELQTSH